MLRFLISAAENPGYEAVCNAFIPAIGRNNGIRRTEPDALDPPCNLMTDSFASEDKQLQMTIQQSLQDIAMQMGHPINEKTAKQLYQKAIELLSHLTYAPITLARMAGTLLVYQGAGGH